MSEVDAITFAIVFSSKNGDKLTLRVCLF